MASRNMPSVQRRGNVLFPQFRRRDHRVLTLVFSTRSPATLTPLKRTPRTLGVHPYHQNEE